MSRAQQLAVYEAQQLLETGRVMNQAEAQALVSHWLQGEMSDLNPWINAIWVEEISSADKRYNKEHTALAHIDRESMTGTVVMVLPQVTERTLIHEVSHILTDFRRAEGTDGHSEPFMRTYLEWVYRLRGMEEWMRFKSALNSELERRGAPRVD